MNDTPLDLSKRYKTRDGRRVTNLAQWHKGRVRGEIVGPDGVRRCFIWYADGAFAQYLREHPLDLIPCEDE